MIHRIFIYCILLFSLLSFSISRAEWKPIRNNQKSQKPSVKIISHSKNEYIVEVNLFGLDSSEIQVENKIYQKILL
ncbi:MAG TPA: hypothetical protein VHP38_12785, partial [Ruminiclostridium sp.]|nr:hypothetical protein [Ruminiclostridium sp.]